MRKALKKAARTSGPLALAVIMMLIALPACGSASPGATAAPVATPSARATAAPSTTAAAPAPATQPAGPSVSILLPPSGAYEFQINVRMIVRVSGFKLVDRIGQANVPGEGHLIYYIGGPPPTAPGQPAFTAPGTYAVSTNTTFLWPRLFKPGPYTLSVQLVNNDNTPLSPPVTAEVAMNVND